MLPGGALSILTSPSGVDGGGARLPNISSNARSGASLDSSGSSYQQSASTGDLIVGGGKSIPVFVYIALAALAAIYLLKR